MTIYEDKHNMNLAEVKSLQQQAWNATINLQKERYAVILEKESEKNRISREKENKKQNEKEQHKLEWEKVIHGRAEAAIELHKITSKDNVLPRPRHDKCPICAQHLIWTTQFRVKRNTFLKYWTCSNCGYQYVDTGTRYRPAFWLIRILWSINICSLIAIICCSAFSMYWGLFPSIPALVLSLAGGDALEGGNAIIDPYESSYADKEILECSEMVKPQ